MVFRKAVISIVLMLSMVQLSWTMPSDTVISLVTCYPGSDIYELEGHSAIRVVTPNGDVAVSYGMFDFDAPNFVYRFVKGETDYRVGVIPWNIFFYSYARQDRRIVEQVIGLTPEQKKRALSLIETNLLPQNRIYRYNYVKDNCATRPLRIIELAIGDSIELQQPENGVANDLSFRQIMRRYHKNYPWYQFGIDLSLGSGIDYPVNTREKAFAPVVLESQMDGAKAGGKKVVSEKNILYYGPSQGAAEGPTPWYLTPLSVFSLLLILIIAATICDLRRNKVTKWIDATLFSIFGMTGFILTFLIFVSEHEGTSPNYLYLWLNPLCLIPPIFIWLKKGNKVILWYQIVNFAVLLILSAVWAWLPQSGNAAFIPVILCDAIRSASYIYITSRNKTCRNGNHH